MPPDIGKLSKSSIWINKIKPTFIEFKWSLGCVDRTILEGYILQYCPINDPKIEDCKEPKKQLNITGDKTIFNLTNLSPYTTYKTIIAMRSAKRVGPPSDSILGTTLEAAPSPPRNLGYRDVTNTSVTLYWDPPEHINGVLIKYNVWFNEKSINVEKRDGKMEYRLRNLTSFMEYEIVVLACTVACSERSNSIKIKTEVGVPGEMVQAKILDAAGIKIQWEAPKMRAGLLQYYELTAKISGEIGVFERTVKINSTECTMQMETCLRGSDKYEFFVRAVNVVHTPHAKSIYKRNVDAGTTQADEWRTKRHSSVENDSSNLNQQPWHTFKLNGTEIEAASKVASHVHRLGKLSFTDSDSSASISNVLAHNIICREQEDDNLKRYFDSDKFAIHLRSPPSPSAHYYCNRNSATGGLYVIITVGLFGIAAITYVSYYVMKKFKKMKDIGVELPEGLEDIGKGKHLNLDCNGGANIVNVNKVDIGRSADALLFADEQEESLLRNRMESGSSNNTENNSNCEYNEAVDDSENEQQMDDDSTHTNSDGNDVCQVKTEKLKTFCFCKYMVSDGNN